MKTLALAVSITLVSFSAMASSNHNHNNNTNVNANLNAARSNVYVGGDDISVSNSTRYSAKSATAGLVLATSDCLGSMSGGLQGAFAGATLGFTKQSKPCNVREFAKMFYEDKEMYNAILCQDKTVRKARASIGKPCAAIAKKPWYKRNPKPTK